MGVFPSGEQVQMRRGELRATVVEVSGGLRVLADGDWEVLDGYPIDEMCHDARGQVLMPWPNRLAGGKYSFAGKQYQAPINEVTFLNAIHGLARWANWRIEETRSDGVTMRHQLLPSPGYPFALDLTAAYVLEEDGLRVTLGAENIGDGPCPFGAGQHPYLRVGTPSIDTALLCVPARTMLRYDERLIPVGREPVAGTSLDFRTARPIGTTAINMDYTDLERDGDGRAWVTMVAPDGGRRIALWMDAAFRHVTVYTGETVQPASRRRQGLAVEPMSCPPNALATGEDLVVLAPGEQWRGRWGLSLSG